MEKEYAPTSAERKQAKPTKQAVKQVALETKKEEIKTQAEDAKIENNEIKTEIAENKVEEKKEKVKTVPKEKRDTATALGSGIHASKKVCMYIGTFIKNKSIDQAIADLEQVVKFKRAVPMKGEIPHRKGIGMMSGRYPIDVSKLFITILKGLKGNAVVNGMDLSRTRIVSTMSNWASQPARGGGVRSKRTHVLITAKEVQLKEKKK